MQEQSIAWSSDEQALSIATSVGWAGNFMAYASLFLAYHSADTNGALANKRSDG
ncbi:MAG: hypothetical protein Kow0088_05250 [Anaerolineales bacterium]